MNSTESATRTPANKPMSREPGTDTFEQPAVIAISPASTPFSAIETSGFLNRNWEVIMAPIAPDTIVAAVPAKTQWKIQNVHFSSLALKSLAAKWLAQIEGTPATSTGARAARARQRRRRPL